MTSGDYLPGLQFQSPGAGMDAITSPGVHKPAAIHPPNPSEDTTGRVAAAQRFDGTDPSTRLVVLTLRSLNLDTTDEPDDPNACHASDCPLKGTNHNRGLFLHDATLGLGVRFHEDFGFSNPPPFVWAAYFRYTRYLARLKDSGDDDVREARDGLGTAVQGLDPGDHLRADDSDIVFGFLRCHAVTFQQNDNNTGGLVEIQWRGKMLGGGGEASVVAGLNAMTL
ncbi:MAG: hypothetical protein L6R36_004162 [Xanthoria steineri]|nr:MAG: hypothetical protein L6R36_004162 [Xanthoria steineri]